jgi:arginase
MTSILNKKIRILTAPSILGLSPGGVEYLPGALLDAGLTEHLRTRKKIIQVETLNDQYSSKRDADTKVLNPIPIKNFSVALGNAVTRALDDHNFPIVLGGDCSIIIGVMSSLKRRGRFGLVFLDAHADFYQPEKSLTGEVADMDLAIVTGRGPSVLTNIDGLIPYVEDRNVIHVGQRDREQTMKYGSQDIRETGINCFDLNEIRTKGMDQVAGDIVQCIEQSNAEGFWLHYDTDVLSDELNPAVDYRLSDGLDFEQIELLMQSVLHTKKIIGMTVTIFNPRHDDTGSVARSIVRSLGKAFSLYGNANAT